VVRGALIERHLLTGELWAENAVELLAPDLGIWPLQIRWLVADGAAVAAGDPVVEFDNSSLSEQLQQVESAVVEAQNGLANTRSQAAATLEQAQFEALQKQADLKKARIEATVPRDLIPGREYQDKQLALQRAELQFQDAQRNLEEKRRAAAADLSIAQVALDRAVAKVQEVKAGIGELTLTAPRAGLVVIGDNREQGRPWQVGDNIFPGRAAARLPELRSMIVKARLHDVDDGRIAPGMPAVITLDAHPDHPLEGVVRDIDRVAQEVDRQSRIRAFGVRVDLAAQEAVEVERMRPGMSVKVVVALRHPEALLVPRQALDWDAPEGPRARRGDGAWATVKLGPCNTEACVVEAGLEEGERLRPVKVDG